MSHTVWAPHLCLSPSSEMSLHSLRRYDYDQTMTFSYEVLGTNFSYRILRCYFFRLSRTANVDARVFFHFFSLTMRDFLASWGIQFFGSRSGFNQVSRSISGFGIRILIQEGKKTPKIRKKPYVWSAGCFSLRAEGFFCSLEILYED